MTDIAQIEVLDDEQPEFFAPVSFDAIGMLVGQYAAMRAKIEHLGAYMAEQMAGGAIDYFLEGNRTEERGRQTMTLSARQLFDVPGAVSALNAAYWSKALQLTDVLDTMPQKRRSEWHDQITNPHGRRKNYDETRADQRQHPEWFDLDGRYIDDANAYAVPRLPDFTDDNVRDTLSALIAMRAQFLGERVDGIFRGLSGEHVTNAPEAFGKRMIIARALSSYGTVEHGTFGLINDLRAVVAKFMGRDEPKFDATARLSEVLKRNWGEWMSLDGGAVRIRLYRKGTAHLEIHPDMAWRLNGILAHLYPLAIPAEFRQKPKRRAKAFVMMGKPLPFAVLSALGDMEPAYTWEEHPQRHWDKVRRHLPRTLQLSLSRTPEGAVRKQAEDVLRALGGVEQPYGKGTATYWQFAYEVAPVMDQVITSGCIPDQQSHQFYPTPDTVARAAIALADIGPGHTCLEPSAGLGGLADHMPKDRTTCVEVAPLHCRILEGKGYRVHEGDFIAWADTTSPRPQFDRIVMNPPYSEGRWKLHTERAYDLLKPGGVLVAVLPASARGKDFLPGATDWSRAFDNEFAGTSVSVVLMKVTRPA